jgi:hypothetical protein
MLVNKYCLIISIILKSFVILNALLFCLMDSHSNPHGIRFNYFKKSKKYKKISIKYNIIYQDVHFFYLQKNLLYVYLCILYLNICMDIAGLYGRQSERARHVNVTRRLIFGRRNARTCSGITTTRTRRRLVGTQCFRSVSSFLVSNRRAKKLYWIASDPDAAFGAITFLSLKLSTTQQILVTTFEMDS